MKNKKLFIIISIILLILFVVVGYIYSFHLDISEASLRANKKSKINVEDLKVNDLRYDDTIKTCEKKLGDPKKTKDFTVDNEEYKTYIYDDLELTFQKKYNKFKLVKAIIKSNKYVDGRKVKVGMYAKRVINRYYVQNKKGKSIYGNFESNGLDNKYILTSVYLGERTKNSILYAFKDKYEKVDGREVPRNIIKIEYKLKNNRVSKIIWSYGTIK